MRSIAASLGALFVLLLAACSPVARPDGGSEEGGQTPVAVGVGYVPSVQFTPFYVGIDKGFFAEEGLDVSLAYGFENDYLKLVGIGENQFMIGSGDQVVLGRAQGLPVRYVMNWFTRYPVVIFAREEAGIGELSDLAGKRIGIPGPFGASYVALRGMLDAAGLGETDVQLESIGFTQAAAVSAGTVDAAVDYGVNGPVVLAQAGIPTTQIALDRYLRIPANGLVTNEETLRENPDLVRGLVRAMLRSIDYTLQHPDEAFEIALRYVPEAGRDNRSANRAIFDASLDYWTPLPGQTPGATELDDWVSAAAFMQRIGLADRLVPAEELFTNEFVE